MDRARDDIAAAGGDVLCVFMYRAAPTRNFCRQRKVELDCYGDPDRALYEAVGLERGGRKELYPAKLGLATIRAARAGAVVGDPKGGDVRQMPGTFVVDEHGRVAYAHYHRDQTNNPPMRQVLDAVRSASR